MAPTDLGSVTMTGISESIARLRTAQKSSRGAPAYSRFVNRPLGRPLAAMAAALGLSPSHVTLLSAACTFSAIGAVALVPPTATSSLVIAALLVLGYALDSADGQLARLTGSASLAGEWLDHCIDAAKAVSIHLAVLVSWARFLDAPPAMLLVPLGFAAVASTFFFALIAVDLLRRIHRLQHPDAPVVERTGGTSPLYALLVVPADYGLLCLLFAALWLPALFVPAYTAVAAINGLLLVVGLVRWHRSLRSLSRAS